MSNPFKAGDKIVLREGEDLGEWGFNQGIAYTVDEVADNNHIRIGKNCWMVIRWRAAIKGIDYDVNGQVVEDPLGIVQQVQPSGHASGGSSVQKHSCGGLYPYVLVYRDKKHGRNADGRYDVGIIGPQNQEPMWFKSLDHAVAVAETMKGNEA